MQTLHDSGHALATIDPQGIGTLLLRDAGTLNIVGTAAIDELTQALRRLAAAPQLRVLVLRGRGDKAFIGGADIGEKATQDAARAPAFITRLAGLCDAVAACPVTVIARLSGWWRNRVANVFLVFFLTSMGTAIGVWLAGFRMAATLAR